MTYGLTDAGFSPKPAGVIEAELIADFRGIPGLENITTGGDSAFGQLISVLSERESSLWQLALAVYQSSFRDYATGQSLDAAAADVFKARRLAARSTVSLTLYNRSSTGPVTVDSFSQVRQSTTGIVFETTDSAEIPALGPLHTALDVDDLLWQSGTIVRANFNAMPDLSNVAIGDEITISGATNPSNDGTFAISAVNVAGYWVEYPNPARTDATDDETSSPATADIDDVETSVVVGGQSVTTGPFEASIGSIDTIVTPVSGWDAVTNLSAANVGRNRETDAEFRIRIAQELAIAQGSTVLAIRAQLLEVPGITFVSAKENRTGVTDIDGNKPHSYRFAIAGGADQDIIDCIGQFGAGAIATNGSVSGTYNDPGGEAITIYFDRVTEVNPYLIVNLTTTGEYPADGDTLIAEALADLEFENGQDLINYLLIGAVAASQVPGILTVQILQGLTPGPVSSANITIPASEVVNITADRATVNS